MWTNIRLLYWSGKKMTTKEVHVWKEQKGVLYWYWLCILIMLCDAFSLHDSYRRGVVGYVKTSVLGTKRPFSAKARRRFWLFWSCVPVPPPPRPKEVQENCWSWQKRKIWFMMTSCITQASLFWGRLFFMACWNKETVNHSWRSIGSDSSPFYHHHPTPAFPFLLCPSLGVLMLMLATECC